MSYAIAYLAIVGQSNMRQKKQWKCCSDARLFRPKLLTIFVVITISIRQLDNGMLLNWVLSDWDQSFQLLVRHRHILNSEDLARVEEKVLSDRAKLLVIRLFLFITLDINTNLW